MNVALQPQVENQIGPAGTNESTRWFDMTCKWSAVVLLLALAILAPAPAMARPLRELQGDEQFAQGNFKGAVQVTGKSDAVIGQILRLN